MWGGGGGEGVFACYIQYINGVGQGILYSHQLYRKEYRGGGKYRKYKYRKRDRRGTL
jgi:hypothetical protein